MSLDRVKNDTFTFRFTTRAFATGIPTALAGSPVLSAMEDAVDTPFTTGVTLTASSVAGLNLCTIDSSQADFEAGKEYDVYLSAGTVDSVSVIGEVVGHFSLSREAAAVDLANGSDGLTALKTAIDGVPTTAEFEARTIVSADYFDPGSDTVATVTTVSNQLSAATIANQVWDTDATGRQSAGTFGQAIGDPGANAETIYDAVVTDAAGTNIAADIIVIEGQTDDIGVAGAGLTAINLPNQTMDIIGDITGNLSGSVGSVTNDVGITQAGADKVWGTAARILTANTNFNDPTVDAIWAKAMTELGAVPGVTGTVLAALEWLFLLARNKGTQTSTTKTLRNDADNGDIATAAISDDTITFTRNEWS